MAGIGVLVRRLLPALAIGLWGCGSGSEPGSAATPTGTADAGSPRSPDAGSDGGQRASCRFDLVAADAGVILDDGCGARLVFTPSVWFGGRRYVGAQCVAEAGAVRCQTLPAELTAHVATGQVVLEAVANSAGSLEGLELAGEGTLPGARAFVSNGFQSWSQSGPVALGPPLDEDALRQTLAAEGDAEVIRDGRGLSWWHTVVGGADVAVVAGALAATRFRSFAAVGANGDTVVLRLVSGGAPADRVTVTPGEHVMGEPWRIAGTRDIPAALADLGDQLAAAARPRMVRPEAGWNSWYELFSDVDREAVLANAAIAREILTPRLPSDARPLRIVVDDGWQQAWGDWTPNAKFPGGMDGLAAGLAADGFTAGVWLAPLLVQADSQTAAAHPEWLLPDATYEHLGEGTMRILDVTHPGARAHLAEVIQRIVGWGYGLLKIDFLFAGAQAATRSSPLTGMAAYRLALETIRAAAGEDTVLVAVGAPALPSLPFVDAWRLGGDIALELLPPAFPFLANQARSLGTRWFVCRAVLCDPDPPVLRVLGQDEVGFGLATVALAGGGLFLSDDLRALSAERRGWLTADAVGLALGGAPATPLDVLPQDAPETLGNAIFDVLGETDTHVLPRRWHAAAGAVRLNPSGSAAVIDGTEVPGHSAVWESRR